MGVGGCLERGVFFQGVASFLHIEFDADISERYEGVWHAAQQFAQFGELAGVVGGD